VSSRQNEIDQQILAASSPEWLKLARIIVEVAEACQAKGITVSYQEVAARTEALAECGALEYQGDLKKWRHSEVRLPAQGT
jgi:hypothetical protein